MIVPTSTYRLQMRNGMTFARAHEQIGYWKALGVGHVYLSPIFEATSGSTHGYDVTDPNRIDPDLGGEEGFLRFQQALQAADIGLILDIVPNHMAASLENAWWRSVLAEGRGSAYAGFFDIDWSERLTLPQLGTSFEEAAQGGQFEVKADDRGGHLVYFDQAFPLAQGSLDSVLGPARDRDSLGALSKNLAFLTALHDRQHWRLMHWQEAASHLSYRRFFEVTGLVGLRVEDPDVFDATHEATLRLVRSGALQGLRIDHVDGLADPGGYLDRLRSAVGPETYIIVEKILGENETLRPAWPVEGTTGYEFVTALTDVFVDAEGVQQLDAAYRAVTGDRSTPETALRDAKQLLVSKHFAGETDRLVRMAATIAPDHASGGVKQAIEEALIAFPVYRTYGTVGPLDTRDETVLGRVFQSAREHVDDKGALDLLIGILKGELAAPAAVEFRQRFQQLSGPIMAKSLEDTLFYRNNRLIALNEVGGDIEAIPGGTQAFHDAMAKRLQSQPHGLSATSTHDTKRGEDARARLYALSEAAPVWSAAVDRWRAMNSHYRADGAVPGANVEWMIYQALAGMWPDRPQEVSDDLRDRFRAYALKAIREAKQGTGWNNPDETYEAGVDAYAAGLLSPDNEGFLADFGRTLAPFLQAGRLNSLSQTLIKLTAPGVPDIYQGAEGFDLSAVDPDNRRPIDFQSLADRLAEQLSDTTDAEHLKIKIVGMLLNFRQRNSALFSEGRYVPLQPVGGRKDHLLAFGRQLGAEFSITIVPRLMFGAVPTGAIVPRPGYWGDTAIALPATFAGPKRDLLSGKRLPPGPVVAETLLFDQPVSVLIPDIA